MSDPPGEPADGLHLLRLQELLLSAAALGHVPEAPDPAHRLAIDPLRPRVAFERAAVLELERVEALGLGSAVQLANLGEESLGFDELIQDEGDGVVVARLEDLGRNPPLAVNDR